MSLGAAPAQSDDERAHADTNHAERLAQRIENEIRRLGLAAGTKVGTMAELAALHGVGPEVFRQAARILEQSGVARMHRGKHGGLIVMAPQLDASAHALATFFEFANVSFEQVSQVNESLRCIIFGPAARALTIKDGDDLRRRLQEFLHSDLDQEGAIWRATFLTFDISQDMVDRIGNPVLSLLHQAIMLYFVDVLPLDRLPEVDGKQAARLLVEHAAELIEASIANDFAASQRVAQGMHKILFALEMDPVVDTARLDVSGDTVGQRLSPAKWTGRWTLADKIARQILRDIRARGWPIGAILGTEMELLASYGVSRATFRQAVRLLEQYSAARMQRGPRGGLVVASPEPGKLVEAIIADLWRAESQGVHARALQIELQTRAIDLLCDSPLPPPLDAFDAHRRALPFLHGVELRAGLHEMQRALINSSGNMVLQVFWSILATIAAPHGIPRSVADSRILTKVAETFPALLESLAARDRARARRALLQYLAAEDEWLVLTHAAVNRTMM